MDEITIRGTRKQANLQVWSQRVPECREGGMPVTQWCESNGISRKTYYRWQKKVFDATVGERREEPKFTVRIGSVAGNVHGSRRGAVAAVVRALTVC